MNVICTKDLIMLDGSIAYKFGKTYKLNTGSLDSGECTITDEIGDEHHSITGWIQYFIPEDFKPKNL